MFPQWLYLTRFTENHCSLSLSSLLLRAKFNRLAGAGIWLHLTFRLVNGTEAVFAAVLFIHEATVALKVIQLEDIIPRYLATCVLPVHVAGCATTVHYTRSLCPVSLCDPARGSPNAGVENSSKVYTQLPGLCSNSAGHLLERVSMAKANLHQQELQFYPRAARLSSSSLHKVPPSLWISLPKKCSSLSPLSCPCRLCAFCYKSLPLLWSQLIRQRAVKRDMELFWFEAWAEVLLTPFQLHLCNWLLWDIGKFNFRKCMRGQPYFCHFLTLNVWIQLSVGGGQASFLKR